MKEGTYWGYFIGSIIKNFKEIIKKANIKPKYTLGEMLVYDNLQLEEKGENSKVINIAINYLKKFRKEIKKSKNSYEMQQTLLKYRKVFDRYGTPQVGAINFNSSNKKSIASNTDNLTWCFGTCVAHLFDDYIKIFNDKHNLNLYCYRKPFKMSKISKFFNSYCDFWEYSHKIKF